MPIPNARARQERQMKGAAPRGTGRALEQVRALRIQAEEKARKAAENARLAAEEREAPGSAASNARVAAERQRLEAQGRRPGIFRRIFNFLSGGRSREAAMREETAAEKVSKLELQKATLARDIPLRRTQLNRAMTELNPAQRSQVKTIFANLRAGNMTKEQAQKRIAAYPVVEAAMRNLQAGMEELRTTNSALVRNRELDLMQLGNKVGKEVVEFPELMERTVPTEAELKRRFVKTGELEDKLSRTMRDATLAAEENRKIQGRKLKVLGGALSEVTRNMEEAGRVAQNAIPINPDTMRVVKGLIPEPGKKVVPPKGVPVLSQAPAQTAQRPQTQRRKAVV